MVLLNSFKKVIHTGHNILVLTLLCALMMSVVFSTLYGGIESNWLNPFENDVFVQTLIWDVRVAKVLAALLTGLCLALAGHLYQVLLDNPLCDPGVLGISSGAGISMALGLLFVAPGASYWLQAAIPPLSGFLGAIISLLLILFIAKRMGHFSQASIILAGICLTTMISALSSWVIIISDNTQLRQLSVWMLGTFELVDFYLLSFNAILLIPTLIWIARFRKRIDLLYLGDSNAKLYGVDPARLRLICLILASLLVAISVSMAGVIGFIGLLIPHAIRLVYGHQNYYILAPIALFGAIVLVWIEWLSRSTLDVQLPAGLITASVGGPLFLLIIIRHFKTQGLHA